MDHVLSLFQSNRLLILSTISMVLAVLVALFRRDSRLDSIPGPKTYPLIGVGYKLPPKAPMLFRQQAQEYGEIFKIRVGQYNQVMIDTPKAIREILEK